MEEAIAMQYAAMMKRQNLLMESTEPDCPQKLLNCGLKLSCTSKLLAVTDSVYAERYFKTAYRTDPESSPSLSRDCLPLLEINLQCFCWFHTMAKKDSFFLFMHNLFSRVWGFYSYFF